MTCDVCARQFDYAFYINDEQWIKVVGEQKLRDGVGHICAHCTLEKLGGAYWYIIENEPSRKSFERAIPSPSELLAETVRKKTRWDQFLLSLKQAGKPPPGRCAGDRKLIYRRHRMTHAVVLCPGCANCAGLIPSP